MIVTERRPRFVISARISPTAVTVPSRVGHERSGGSSAGGRRGGRRCRQARGRPGRAARFPRPAAPSGRPSTRTDLGPAEVTDRPAHTLVAAQERGTPVARRKATTSSSTSRARSSSSRISSSASACRSGWVCVWLPRSWPRSASRRSVRRRVASSIASPIAKNVPRPSWRSSASAIGSVHSEGPSSKVSATTGDAMPRRASIVGACRRIRAGSHETEEQVSD